RIAAGRITRRRALAGTAAMGGAAALLAACGGSGGESKPVSEEDKAKANSKIFTNDKEEGPAKKGGVWNQPNVEPVNFDAFAQATVIVAQNAAGWIQSRLLKYKSAPGLDPNLFTLEGDLAQSWEVSNDGLTYTFKLRPNVKWQNI